MICECKKLKKSDKQTSTNYKLLFWSSFKIISTIYFVDGAKHLNFVDGGRNTWPNKTG